MMDKAERPVPIQELPVASGIERAAQLVLWIVEAGDYMDRLEAEKALMATMRPNGCGEQFKS